MVSDLKQPTHHWLADLLENFSELLNEGEDPSCTITYEGVEIEVRLNKIPGHFERKIIRNNHNAYIDK
jgi:hypothetical protein